MNVKGESVSVPGTWEVILAEERESRWVSILIADPLVGSAEGLMFSIDDLP